MKKTFLLGVVICFISNLGFGQKTIDKIVAQVGDNIILYSEVQGQIESMKQNGAPEDQVNQCDILEQMMYNYLLVNQAELDSVQISDEQVDAEMENRLRMIESQMRNVKDENGNPITIESFYGKSKAQIKEEFRKSIKQRMQGQEVERGILNNVSVSPREVQEFYDKIPKDSLPFINSQLIFQQIGVFPVLTNDDKERARTELEGIRKQIVEQGKSFETMARIYSRDPGSAKLGGRIEATRGMMVKPFEATAYSLKINQVSNVFETEYGFHIMKLLERKGDDYVCLHILIPAEYNPDSIQAAETRINTCYQQLRDGKITWEQAVQRYSNDKNTKENNGIIMNPITGEIKWSLENINEVDPTMFQMTDGLEKGQFTTVMNYYDYNERREAMRIIRLMERTKPHVANLTDDYNLFRMMAEEQKKQEAIVKWTKSRINTIYIRIDDEFKTCNFQYNWLATQ